MKTFLVGAVISSLLILTACQKHEEPHEFVVKEVEKPVLGYKEKKPAATEEGTGAGGGSDLEVGKKIWMSTCTQCHNKDPNIKGSVGPETVDAPLEVMYAKVMTGRYPDPLPEGFVPKRNTKAMRKLPQYEKEIPKIWAYVQSVKKKK